LRADPADHLPGTGSVLKSVHLLTYLYMAEPFLSEIRMVSFNFPPKGWALANGQLLPINQNQALFALLGTTYGGNGQTNFALPDFRGRVPIHFSGSHNLGERAGSESTTVNIQQLPQHTHFVTAIDSNSANNNNPIGNYLSNTLPNNLYSNSASSGVFMNAATVSNTGGSQPHSNMQPYLALSFIIALQGIFPSRN
jgi:microcystin-dependent protein